MAGDKNATNGKRPHRPPATTPEDRERQLAALAYDIAEKQMRDGTATSQIITTFLKVGAQREKLELERITRENELLRAKVENLKSMSANEDLYREAIAAMQRYAGEDDDINYQTFDD